MRSNSMIQDLHAHTYYSFCGKDAPEKLIETAIENKIEVLGICDHNYGIGMQRESTIFPNDSARLKDYQRALDAYCNHMRLLAEKYKKHIRLVVGVEIATLKKAHLLLPETMDLSGFDYCLIEHIDRPDSIVKNLFDYIEHINCPTIGIAHTDIPTYLETTCQDPREFFSQMVKHNIFWEMNVNYDSIHKYREHQYVKDTLQNHDLIHLLKSCNVQLSVGFDGHRIEDYAPQRVIDCCQTIEALGLKLVDV